MGYVQKLFVNYTGQRVKVGQELYGVYSPDLVSAQAEYLQVFKKHRLKRLWTISPKRAETAHELGRYRGADRGA